MDAAGWFGVRCVFKMTTDGDNLVYEERITLWRAADAHEAITLAETEALAYAKNLDAQYLGLAQAYPLAEDVGVGTEVFSLMRTSSPRPSDYQRALRHWHGATDRPRGSPNRLSGQALRAIRHDPAQPAA